MSERDALIQQLDQYGRAVFSPEGYSMYPMLRDSVDVVTVARPKNDVRRLDVALYLDAHGEYVLHRVIKIENGTYLLMGDGRLTADPPIMRDSIIAVVTGFYRGKRFIDTRRLFYRMYAHVWGDCLFARRFLLSVCHKAGHIKAIFRGDKKNDKK